jgi:hypothetical protein
VDLGPRNEVTHLSNLWHHHSFERSAEPFTSERHPLLLGLALPLESVTSARQFILVQSEYQLHLSRFDNARISIYDIWTILLHSCVNSIPIIVHHAITVFAYSDSFSPQPNILDICIHDIRFSHHDPLLELDPDKKKSRTNLTRGRHAEYQIYIAIVHIITGVPSEDRPRWICSSGKPPSFNAGPSSQVQAHHTVERGQCQLLRVIKSNLRKLKPRQSRRKQEGV